MDTPTLAPRIYLGVHLKESKKKVWRTVLGVCVREVREVYLIEVTV